MCGRLTSSTVAPAASSAATASRTRASTPGSMPGTKYSRRQPEALAAQPRRRLVVRGGQPDEVVGHGDRRRRRVALVAAGDRVQQRRGVARVARERPDLVEAARERDDPVAADRGRRSASSRRRRTAPPAGGSSRRCRCRSPSGAWNAATAAAEPPRRAARHAVEVPRVGRRPERRVLGRRAHRELVHVRLAQDHRAGVAQPLGDVGVVRRAVALEDPRARGGTGRRATETRSLSATGMPSSGCSVVDAPPAPSARAAASRASAASASASARSSSIVSQAWRPRSVRVGAGEVRRRDLARA